MSRSLCAHYLTRYAEPETRALANLTTAQYDRALVVPCYAETVDFFNRFRQQSYRGTTLVIVIINQPDATTLAADAQAGNNADAPHPLNRDLLNYFLAMGPAQKSGQLILIQPQTNTHWLIVDRCHPRHQVPARQGVGLARKIGCDLAAWLYYQGHLASSWIHCTDADCVLPANYFALPQDHASAWVYPFIHEQIHQTAEDERLPAATRVYESCLNYYVAGLAHAGSRYAYHTLGSTMAVSAPHYCQARGFPRRAGGEDFYLLNKLAKLAPVRSVSRREHDGGDDVIKIQIRQSRRVPFGTGPAVTKLMQLDDPWQTPYYHPEVFSRLRSWLQTIPGIWHELAVGRAPLAQLHPSIAASLQRAGIHKVLTHIQRQARDAADCERALHEWFDAFQTLKFIHDQQARHLPPIPLAQAVQVGWCPTGRSSQDASGSPTAADIRHR